MRYIVLVLCVVAGSVFGATDYASRYQELKDKGFSKNTEALLDDWREKVPNDPDAWIASANYYFNKASAVNISAKPPEKDDITIADQKTGKVAGSISFGRDPQLTKKAICYLSEAVKRFPQRLDIWCGLCYSHQEAGDFDAQIEVISNCVAYAVKRPHELRWLKDQPLPSTPDDFVPEKLHGYTSYYLNKQTASDDQKAFKIAELTATSYPSHPFALNDLAALYTYKSDFSKAREYLEKAQQVAPSDPIVLLNLADVCVKLKDIQGARTYYQKVIDMKPDANDLAAAKTGLQQIQDRKKWAL